jgi:hypothetical protein
VGVTLAAVIADKQGFFKEEGLEIEASQADGTSAAGNRHGSCGAAKASRTPLITAVASARGIKLGDASARARMVASASMPCDWFY